MGGVPLNPRENTFVVATADDLPDVLSRFVVYNFLYDPGAGIGLYYTSDESALIRVDAAEINDLSAAVTWANVPDANITQGSVTQHEAALTILESQITDGAILTRIAADETITGDWILDGDVTRSDFGTGGDVKDGVDSAQPIGFNVMPAYEIDVADDFDLAHNGMLWHKDANAGIAFTCEDDSTIPQGATYCVVNRDTEDVTIEEGAGVTLHWMDGGGVTAPTGTRTLAEAGVATVYKYNDTTFYIWGVGLT